MDVKEYERRFEKAYSRLVEAHGFFFVWRALQKKEYEDMKRVMRKMKFWEDELLKYHKRLEKGEPYSDFPPK